MATTVTHTIRSSGGDYTSLSAWESDQQRDLVTADEIALAECYNDWASGLVDPTEVSGWTWDSTHYVEIRAAAGHIHNGMPKDGAGDFTGFALVSNSSSITLKLTSSSYAKVYGLIIWNSSTDAALFCRSSIRPIAADRCIFHAANHKGFLQTSNQDGGAANSLAFKCGVGFSMRRSNWALYNCTAVGCTNAGIEQVGGSSNAKVINCLSADNGTDFSMADTTHIVQYCASSDATADDTDTTGNRINQTFTFVDAANDDYHLDSADAGAKGFGTDLSADADYPFDWDVDGDTRGTTWDIGFDQITGVGGGLTTSDVSVLDLTATLSAPSSLRSLVSNIPTL